MDSEKYPPFVRDYAEELWSSFDPQQTRPDTPPRMNDNGLWRYLIKKNALAEFVNLKLDGSISYHVKRRFEDIVEGRQNWKKLAFEKTLEYLKDKEAKYLELRVLSEVSENAEPHTQIQFEILYNRILHRYVLDQPKFPDSASCKEWFLWAAKHTTDERLNEKMAAVALGHLFIYKVR